MALSELQQSELVLEFRHSDLEPQHFNWTAFQSWHLVM